MDEEAEHEVVAGEPVEEAAEALARAQAAAELAHHLLAEPSWPDEGHAAVRAHAARGRLADVVQQRAEAERLAARELVRQRLREHRAQPRRQLAEHRLQPPSSSIWRASTSSVWPYTSRWW